MGVPALDTNKQPSPGMAGPVQAPCRGRAGFSACVCRSGTCLLLKIVQLGLPDGLGDGAADHPAEAVAGGTAQRANDCHQRKSLQRREQGWGWEGGGLLPGSSARNAGRAPLHMLAGGSLLFAGHDRRVTAWPRRRCSGHGRRVTAWPRRRCSAKAGPHLNGAVQRARQQRQPHSAGHGEGLHDHIQHKQRHGHQHLRGRVGTGVGARHTLIWCGGAGLASRADPLANDARRGGPAVAVVVLLRTGWASL